MEQRESKFKFFYQTGWIAVATALGGAFMYAVHMVAKDMPKSEYGVFTALLQVLNLMGIPAIGLQSVFAQQAASAVGDAAHQQLVGTVRSVMKGILWIWLVMVGVLVVAQQYVIDSLQVANPAALWMTAVVGLFAMWMPIMSGLLQGQQSFFWYGLVSIAGGFARFLGVVIIVRLLGGWAAGGMTAVLFGLIISLGIGAWQNRACWIGAAQSINWREWLGRVVPLTLGAGATLFMMSADMIFVQKYFDRNETGFYAAAGMIGRALVFFTAPVAAVMFPKIVRQAATGEKSTVLLQALGVTALLGMGAALFCTVLPEFPLRLVYDKTFLKVAPVVPWFVWCVVPLTVANVLVNNLLARKQFKVVPWLILLAGGYALALQWRASTADKTDLIHGFSQVVQMLGLFSLGMVAICLWFSLKNKQNSAADQAR
ncbi:MAG: hypothetical protein WCO56_05960 [Verrucomicrobiota bacterium]